MNTEDDDPEEKDQCDSCGRLTAPCALSMCNCTAWLCPECFNSETCQFCDPSTPPGSVPKE